MSPTTDDRADDRAGEIADLVHTIGRRLRHATTEGLERLGCTWAQLRVLRQLVQAGEPVRMSDLADRLDIVPRSATSFVDALEEARLATRSPDPTDRRATLVAPTQRGRRLVDSAQRLRRSAIAPMLERLEPDEQARLADFLRRLLGPASASPMGR
jgi:DNA-binding MarR family transcriptional regulator